MAPRCTRDGAPPVGTCVRCGTFLCATCARGTAVYRACPGCWARLRKEGSRRTRTALGLATVGLVTFIPGPVALGLALAELRAMRRGDAFPGAEDDARLARTLGLVETVVLLGALALLALHA